MQKSPVARSFRFIVLSFALTVVALLTAGCGAGIQFSNEGMTSAGGGLQGIAHGGYFPVQYGQVKLWYPGTTGYGSAPTQLGPTLTAAADGGFAFAAGAYTCPDANMPVYLTVTGGNPGISSSTNNSYIALAAYVGPCGTANSQYTVVNEISTIALAFATAQFSGASQAANGLSQVNSYTVTNAGTGYTDSTLTVSFSGGNCTTEPTATALPVAGGSVTAGTYITATNAAGCTSAPTVSLSGAGGTGATAVANFSPVGGSGSVGGTTIGSVSGTTASNGGNIGAPIGTITAGVAANQLAYTDLQNAFLTAQTIADTTHGIAGSMNNTNAVVETTKVNSLANILASCVQSDGTTLCPGLAAVGSNGVTPTGHTVPVDTLQIAQYMALSPTTNVTNVYNTYSTPQPEFGTSLSAAPFDWTIGVTFGSLDMNTVYYAAVDTKGNIWMANRNSPAGLVEVGPSGTSLSGTTYSGGSKITTGSSGQNSGLVIDARGHIWVSLLTPANELVEFNPAATSTSTVYAAASGCSPSALTENINADFLYACAGETSTAPILPLNGLQNHGTLTAPDYTNGTSTIGNTSTIGTNSTTTAPTLAATDIFGNVFVPIYISGTAPAAVMSPGSFSGGLPTTYNFTSTAAGSGSSPVGILVDHNNNILMTSSSTLNKFAVSTYTNTHTSTSSAGGMTGARFATLDGAGDVWVSNGNAGVVTSGSNAGTYYTITEINNALVGITPILAAATTPGGYAHNYGTPRGIVTDGSGNVWVPNNVATTTTANQLTEVIGVAVPVYTPLGAAAANNRLGTLP